MALSLEKKTELVRLSLAKRNVPTGIKLAVKAAIDVSSSMQSDYQNGVMQELIDRLLPVAMRFDDNQSIECYPFGTNASQVADIRINDFGDYIQRFLKSVPNNIIWTGTKYSEALKLISKGLGGAKTFLGFGKKKPIQPSYLMFITDGDTNGDEFEAENLIAGMIDKKVYIQMIGIGRGSNFSFLNRLGNDYPHVEFVTFPNLAGTSDEQMYEQLLSEKFCNWIKKQ